MDYIVRCFKDKDYVAVLNVWQQTDMGGAHRGDNLEIIKETLSNGGELLILEDAKTAQIIGTSWITNDKRRLYLHHFGILPEYQKRGLSNLLMNRSMEFARNSKLQIKLEVHNENIVARKLYEKYGFKYLGEYDVFIVREY